MQNADHELMQELLAAYGISSERVLAAHFAFDASGPTRITVDYAGGRMDSGTRFPRTIKTFKTTEVS